MLAELTADVAKVTREAILAMDTLIVVGTPVDEGRAKANWTVSVGSPRTDQIDFTGDVATAERFAIAQAQVAVKDITGFGVAYLQNNLPYIVPLNDGSSQQAPRKYIDVIVQQVADAS